MGLLAEPPQTKPPGTELAGSYAPFVPHRRGEDAVPQAPSVMRRLLRHRTHSLALRMALALGLALLAFTTRLALGGLSEGHAVEAFVPAVIVATLAFGVMPGLWAVLISGTLATWGFVAPVASLSVTHLWDARVWIILALTAMATVVAIEVMWLAFGDDEAD